MKEVRNQIEGYRGKKIEIWSKFEKAEICNDLGMCFCLFLRFKSVFKKN